MLIIDIYIYIYIYPLVLLIIVDYDIMIKIIDCWYIDWFIIPPVSHQYPISIPLVSH